MVLLNDNEEEVDYHKDNHEMMIKTSTMIMMEIKTSIIKMMHNLRCWR